MLGPFWWFPTRCESTRCRGDKRVEQIQERPAVFTPEALEVAGRADAKTLRRSVFEVSVYAARLKLSGRFGIPRIGDVNLESTRICTLATVGSRSVTATGLPCPLRD